MSDIEYDLMGRFLRLEWLLRRWNMQNRRTHGPMGDPHRGQGRILALLKLRPEISQKELAFLLNISPQSLGELLAKLEKSGYITRQPSEADRRVMIVKLTPEGEAAAELEYEEEDLFGSLNADEQGNLAFYLDKLIASLEERFGGEDDERTAAWRAGWRKATEAMGSFRMRPMSGAQGRGFGMKGEGGPFGDGMEFWFGGGKGPAPFDEEPGAEDPSDAGTQPAAEPPTGE